jgi:hypothetical protein
VLLVLFKVIDRDELIISQPFQPKVFGNSKQVCFASWKMSSASSVFP